jgi:hypothetical protein
VSAAISPTLGAVLRAERHQLNERFAVARLRHPDLDAEAFAGFIRGAVDPLVGAVARTRFERVTDVTLAAYDIALELVGQKLVGRSARTPHVGGAWRRILPEVAPLVAADPQRMIGAVCNASHHVSSTPGARPGAWIDLMVRLAGQCSDTATFLTLGQVAAWRAGMAHFREGALAAADKLPASLAACRDGRAGGRIGRRFEIVSARIRGMTRPHLTTRPRCLASWPVRVRSAASAVCSQSRPRWRWPTGSSWSAVAASAGCSRRTHSARRFTAPVPEEFERARAQSALPEGFFVAGRDRDDPRHRCRSAQRLR